MRVELINLLSDKDTAIIIELKLNRRVWIKRRNTNEK